MPSAKLTALADLAGGQVPTDLCYIVDVSAGTSGSKKSTLNDFLQEITQNITDKSVGFAGGSVATVSAASKGKIRYNEVTQTFQASRNTAAYINFVVGSGSVTQVTVWNTSTDEVTGYASLIYDDSNKLLRLFASSFLPTMQVENSSATDPAMIRAFGGSGRHQVYNFGAAASLEMYRGTTGPTFPGSGADVGQIIMAPANSTSVNPTTVGGARILTTTTQATVLGVGGGVGMVIETAGNNEVSRTRRFLINQHGCVVVGANGQGITGTYGGTSTNVVLGQLTTYNANAAIQCGNPFTGNDNITFLIQANSGQTQAIFQLQTSAGASLYSVGSSGSHTYIGIGGGVAVSPANQGRIYYDTVDQAFKVSQNGGSYRDMVFTAAGVAGSVQYNNGSNAVDGDTGFVWDSPSATLILGDASVLSGKILFRNSTNANTLTLQPGATGANITLTLPTTDGNAGEFLQTDGSGVLSWAAGGGGITIGTTTITSGTAGRILYETSGNVVGEIAGSSVTSVGDVTLAPTASTSGSPTIFTITGPADTTLSGGTHRDTYLNLSRNITFNPTPGDNITWRFLQIDAVQTWTSSTLIGSLEYTGLRLNVVPTFSTNVLNVGAIYSLHLASTGATLRNEGPYSQSSAGIFQIDGGSTFGGRVQVNTDGTIGINKATSVGAMLHVVSGATTTIANRVDSATNSTVDLLQYNLNADDTSTVANLASYQTNSNGTAANGFGSSFTFNLESSTTADQNAARLSWLWSNATHANRTSALTISIVDNASALTEIARFGGGTNTLAITAPIAGYVGLIVNSAASPTADIARFTVNGTTTAGAYAGFATGLTLFGPRATYTGAGGGSTNINFANGNVHEFTFGAGNETLTFSNIPNAAHIILTIIQDGVGTRTLTWPATAKFIGGAAPTLSTGAGERDIIVFYSDGTNLYQAAPIALDVS